MITCVYDAAHAAWRESLVPVAEAMADGRCPEPKDANVVEHREWTWRWDRAFHAAMEELTADPMRSSSGALS